MRIGLQIPRFNWPGGPEEMADRLRQIAVTAEEAGFSSLWVMDHLMQIPIFGEPEDPMLESYTTLGYLAGVTNSIRLGPLVGAVTFRQPGLLIKAATTLNVLAKGRSYFSIGAAWYAEEAAALGMPFPDQPVRFQMLEEVLQLAHQMWSGDQSPFSGRHFDLERPVNQPPPVSRPRPPILIGGNGERRTLRLVARYADACNFLALDPDQVRAKLEVLKRHCDEAGRPFDEIERTSLNPITYSSGAMSSSEMVRWLRSMADAGIQHAIINLPDAHELTPLEIIGREVVPEVIELAIGR